MTSSSTAQLYSFPKKPEITDLPFVSDSKARMGPQNPKGRSFWDVRPTGDYGKDCATGGEYALAALRYAHDADCKQAISWAIQSMPGYDNSSGIEVGFSSTIADYALACFSHIQTQEQQA